MPDIKTTLQNLPPEWSGDVLNDIKNENEAFPSTLVVLDDDPTGTQTVHDVPVITRWDYPLLKEMLVNKEEVFFILTNSRAFSSEETRTINLTIGERLRQASRETGRKVRVISRSDSTLRGHYPLEIEALANGLQMEEYITILNPAFMEGGRYTIDDTHYVLENDQYTPAASTPFAQDATFGYSHSYLPAWVEEKSNGKIGEHQVKSISLNAIREGGAAKVQEIIQKAGNNDVIVVNALTRKDLEVAALGIIREEHKGRKMLYRTAASIVPVLVGMLPKPILDGSELIERNGRGGLVIVGSHVPKSTQQLNYLLEHNIGLESIEVDVHKLVGEEDEIEKYLHQTGEKIDRFLENGKDVVIYTSRELLKGSDADKSLHISATISDKLVSLINLFHKRPAYIICKGGITSSDIATKGLAVTKAMVKGPILPGVPVWQLNQDSKWPDLPFVIFPGNVGGTESLSQVVNKIKSL